MNRTYQAFLCLIAGLAISISSASAQDVKANAGSKQIKPTKSQTVKPFSPKQKAKMSDLKAKIKKKKAEKKKAEKKKAKKKTVLFDKLQVGTSKNQKWRNSYLLGIISKLAYQPDKHHTIKDKKRKARVKKAYGDTTDHNVKTSKNGKVKKGGKVNPARFNKFGLELCNPEMPYWTTKKNKRGKKVIDAQAYLVHNDTSVVLVFRGTAEKSDWRTNLDVVVKYKLKPESKYGKNVKVHRGWLDATELAHKQLNLQANINKCLTKDGKQRKLFVTGHSLGGAMATLWSYYFRKNNKSQASRLYTFGAPSAGNKKFVKSFNRLTGKKFKAYTWVNQDDPVTGITYTSGFRRTGKPHWITCPGIGQFCKPKKLLVKYEIPARAPGALDQHTMTTYFKRILRLGPKKVKDQLSKLASERGGVSKYIKKVYK